MGLIQWMVSNGQSIEPGLPIYKWPHRWVRVLRLAKHVQNVYERAQMEKEPESAVPPRWMWFEEWDRLEQWWKNRRDEIQEEPPDF